MENVKERGKRKIEKKGLMGKMQNGEKLRKIETNQTTRAKIEKRKKIQEIGKIEKHQHNSEPEEISRLNGKIYKKIETNLR